MLSASEVGGASPDVAERRQGLRALATLTGGDLSGDVAWEGLSLPAADGAPLELRRYRPPVASEHPAPALLYLHGGGWVAGDLQTHASVCATLALAGGCDVFALHYRRPPEHRFPGPIEDVLDALEHLRREAQRLGLDPARIGLGGDSAGANLAAAASHDPRADALALRLLICPILDLPRATGSRAAFGEGYFLSRERLDDDARDYLQGVSPDDARASPLHSPSLGRAAITLVHAAAYDPFRDEARDYAERLQAEGAPVSLTVHPGMIHYFYAMPTAIPYARRALAMIGAQVSQAFEMV